MYDNPEDVTALTPAHFIIGKNLMVLPELHLTECKENLLKKLQRIEVSVQHVWNRWKNEFLSELQNRVKWKRISQCNFKVGTLVLVKHDSGPILDWKLGRILKYPGKDNVCRVVDIKTRQGTIRRSVNQICALPRDPSFYTSNVIDIPIVTELFLRSLNNEKISLGTHALILQNTKFGWMLSF
ncbi:hypothetical protein YQE_04139, partial [Dendroctonus ponderosae]